MSTVKVRGYLIYTDPYKHNNDPIKPSYIANFLADSKETEQVLLDAGLQPTRFGMKNKNPDLIGKLKQASANKGMENIKTTGRDVFFVFKRPVSITNKKTGQTTMLSPPTVADINANPISDKLGNGTYAELTLSIRTWTNNGQAIVNAQLESIQVLSLVHYTASSSLTPITDYVPSEESTKNILS